jgi:hypothetical protein
VAVNVNFEDLLIFAGSVTGMGCTTAIILTMIKHRSFKGPRMGEMERRLEEIGDRLNRIETGVDSTALEVERIAEGQRFTTRLLSERSGASGFADKPRSGGSTTPH